MKQIPISDICNNNEPPQNQPNLYCGSCVKFNKFDKCPVAHTQTDSTQKVCDKYYTPTVATRQMLALESIADSLKKLTKLKIEDTEL